METTFDTDLMQELMAFMDTQEVIDLNIDTEAVSENRFSISTREQANFFVKKIAGMMEEIDTINRLKDYEISTTKIRVEAWAEQSINPLQNQIEFLSGFLKEFATKELEGKDTKNVKLPAGTVGFRKQLPEYIYEDDELIKASIKTLPEEMVATLIRTKEEPNKVELKKVGVVKDGHLEVNGTAISGMTVVPRDPKFEVKPTKK